MMSVSDKNARRVKVVFTDMDGTLLDATHKISQYTQNVLKRLKEETDVYFVVATGRPFIDVFPTLGNVNLKPDYIITSNGSRIHDRNLDLVYEHNMNSVAVKKILDKANELSLKTGKETEHPEDGRLKYEIQHSDRKIAANVFDGSDWFVDYAVPQFAQDYHPLIQYQVLGDDLYKQRDDRFQSVHEMFFLGNHSDLEPLQQSVASEFGDSALCTFSLPFLLNCDAAGVSKATAVTEVCKLLGIDVSETASFGDGMNDETMLALTRQSFVMANATPALSKAVPRAEVIGSNANDGVARQLEKMFFS